MNYHLQLGAFVSAFAGIQVNLFSFLGAISNLPYEAAQALFANISVDNSMEKIKKVMSIRKFPTSDINEINRCLIQMRAINKARNDIIHYGIEGENLQAEAGISEFFVSNRTSALTPDKLTRFVVSGPIIRAMTEDIGQILLIIGILISKYHGKTLEISIGEVREEWRWKRRDALP